MSSFMETLTANLAERDAQLAQQAAQLAEKDAQLAQKAAQLTEKDAQLAQQAAQLAEKDTQLAQQAAQLAERDAQLMQQTAQLELFSDLVCQHGPLQSTPPQSPTIAQMQPARPHTPPAQQPGIRARMQPVSPRTSPRFAESLQTGLITDRKLVATFKREYLDSQGGELHHTHQSFLKTSPQENERVLVLTTSVDHQKFASDQDALRGILVYTDTSRSQVLLLHVCPAHRRKGYATRLAEEMKTKLRGKRVSIQKPACQALNAVKLWLSVGFTCSQDIFECHLAEDAAYAPGPVRGAGRSVSLSFSWFEREGKEDETRRDWVMHVEKVREKQPSKLGELCDRLIGPRRGHGVAV